MKKNSEKYPESLTRLEERIIQEAEEKVRKIKEETKLKLEEFNKETKEEIEKIKKTELEKEKSRLVYIANRVKAESEQKARKILIQTKEGLIDKVYSSVEEHLSDFRERKDYSDFIRKKLLSTIGKIKDKKLKLIIDKKDVKVIKEITKNLENSKTEFEIRSEELKSAGGFILTDMEERIRMDFTIEHLLSENKEKIRSKIKELLFT